MCEMKFKSKPIGLEVIDEVQRKALWLQEIFPKMTIMPVFISKGEHNFLL
jgi:hypothetical protein